MRSASRKSRSKLRAFNRREFQDLLFKCHSILRDVHKMELGRAFDMISKICSSRCMSSDLGCTGHFRLITLTVAPIFVCPLTRRCTMASSIRRKITTKLTTYLGDLYTSLTQPLQTRIFRILVGDSDVAAL